MNNLRVSLVLGLKLFPYSLKTVLFYLQFIFLLINITVLMQLNSMLIL